MLTNGNAKMRYTWGGLQVAQYKDKDIAPLFPLLEQEFSNWSSKKISSLAANLKTLVLTKETKEQYLYPYTEQLAIHPSYNSFSHYHL